MGCVTRAVLALAVTGDHLAVPVAPGAAGVACLHPGDAHRPGDQRALHPGRQCVLSLADHRVDHLPHHGSGTARGHSAPAVAARRGGPNLHRCHRAAATSPVGCQSALQRAREGSDGRCGPAGMARGERRSTTPTSPLAAAFRRGRHGGEDRLGCRSRRRGPRPAQTPSGELRGDRVDAARETGSHPSYTRGTRRLCAARPAGQDLPGDHRTATRRVRRGDPQGPHPTATDALVGQLVGLGTRHALAAERPHHGHGRRTRAPGRPVCTSWYRTSREQHCGHRFPVPLRASRSRPRNRHGTTTFQRQPDVRRGNDPRISGLGGGR